MQQRIVRRRLRDSSNPLELPVALFTQHLLDVIDISGTCPKKSFGVPLIVKLSTCLRFFAEGGYQKGVSRDYAVGMAQSTFYDVLATVLPQFSCIKSAKSNNISGKYLQFILKIFN